MHRFALFGFALLTLPLAAAEKGKDKPVWTDAATAAAEHPAYSFQGEYGVDAKGHPWGLQVVAYMEGALEGALLEGGLPGCGHDRSKKRIALTGTLTGATATLKDADGNVSVVIKDGVAQVQKGGASLTPLRRIERTSPTLGLKAPADALVLFDGRSADAWEGGKLDGELLQATGITSKEKFQSYHLHLEFRTPYLPWARGQRRGNSGVYHQNRYETQILDSFGLVGRMNETGGIYSIAEPRINMCFPPLRWQTYDVDFTAAKFQDGKKVKNARMTVRLNGVLIHDDQELPKSTTASKLKDGPEPGGIHLQAHGSPVRFRNIWVIRK